VALVGCITKDGKISRNRPRNKFIADTLATIGEIPKVKLRQGLSEKGALESEVALIAAIGRIDLGTGPLTNMTDGGEGMVGYKFTKEQIAARSRAVSAGHLKHAPEIRSERARQRENRRGFEATSATAKKRLLHMTPEKRRIAAINGGRTVGLALHIINGTKNRRIAPGSPLPDGWHFGRTIMPSAAFAKCASDTRWINDGHVTRRLAPDETLPFGWVYGRRLSKAASSTSQGSMALSPTTTSDPALPSLTKAT
jgi:hypothetical protein